jgi:Protein of unknown function (DUF4199)
MKKRTLLLAIASGVAISLFMNITVDYCNGQESAWNMLVGYTAMILAFSVIFVAIKKQRDENGGVITFGRAFRTALLITFITSTIYVIAWLVNFHLFMPDFMDRYAATSIKAAQAAHLSPQQLKEKIDSINQMKEMYRSTFWVIVYTYAEIFPVGLIISLIAALILKRSGDKREVVAAN